MYKIITYVVISLFLFVSKANAQDTFENRAKKVAAKIESITKEEKEALKKEVEEVNVQLENGSITNEQADEKKKKLAEARAVIIENKVDAVYEELKILVQDKVANRNIATPQDSVTITLGKHLILKYEKDTLKYKKEELGEKRTTSQFVFAMGLNNLATDGDFEDSDFRFLGSHFYEWGVTYNTRMIKESNLLHFKYGWSVMYNNLRPTENRFFEKKGDQTELVKSTYDLDESRFRNVYLVAPLHLEFDFSAKKQKEGKTYFKTHNSFRFGMGGYGGIRLKTKQILKFDDEFGDDVKQKTKKDFNASNFIYGLSAYIGYKETSLYVKYDLNPLFQDNTVKQNNVSLGIRWDFN